MQDHQDPISANESQAVQPQAESSHVLVSPVTTSPKKSNRGCLVALLIVFGIPLLLVAYQVSVGLYYSPSWFYARSGSKAAAESVGVKKTYNERLDLLDSELLKVARDMPIVVPKQVRSSTTRSTTPTTTGVVVASPITAELTHEGDRVVQHVCQAVTITGGSKFNEHPVGQRMTCSYGVEQVYRWTGDEASLKDVMSKTATNLQLKPSHQEYEQYVTKYNFADDKDTNEPTLLVDLSSSGPTQYGLDLASPRPDWQKVFENTKPTPKPYDSSLSGEWLTVSLVKEYYVFFDRNL